MGSERARIIAVANEKGGVGKTVTVVNLAAGLSLKGKKVLIVDMDPQASATRSVGVAVEPDTLTTYEIIKDNKSVNAWDAVVATAWEGLDLIPASPDLAGADIELVQVFGRENRLKKGLDGFAEVYDYIFLDTPPSLSLLTVNVFAYATEVVVPCQTQPFAFAALDDLLDTIQAVREEINSSLEVSGIVATMFDRRTRVSHNVLDQLKTDPRCKDLLFDTVIRINTVIAESTGVGKPVIFHKPGSYGARDYSQLAEEVGKL